MLVVQCMGAISEPAMSEPTFKWVKKSFHRHRQHNGIVSMALDKNTGVYGFKAAVACTLSYYKPSTIHTLNMVCSFKS